MEAFDEPTFMKVVNNAFLVIPDGKPLSIVQKLFGFKNATQVRGQDIMNELCSLSTLENIKIGLYGGSSNSLLKKVISTLEISYPGIKIVYSYSPPFRDLSCIELEEVHDNINNACVDILFVGIGCPKQEIWMSNNTDNISCIMLGVGAAFDFISGEKSHAPVFIQKIGLEWLFRLISEPKRLWYRYFKHNPRFVYYILRSYFIRLIR